MGAVKLQKVRKNRENWKLLRYLLEFNCTQTGFKWVQCAQCGKVCTIKRDYNFYGKINIFCQINVFTKELTKELISRKFLSVIVI